MNSKNFTKIEKEQVSTLKFPDKEVLTDLNKILERSRELSKALTLGNMENHKVKIFFEDDVSHKVVETTIWGITDKRIILKKNEVIPIKRVHSVLI